MNHKNYTPDEATLMAYLYDELKEAERQQVEKYLEENPAAKAEIEGMQGTRSIMGMLSDEDAGEPLILMDQGNESPAAMLVTNEPASKTKLITMGFARTMIGVAAAIILVFLMGALTNLKIKSGNEGFAISFGGDQLPANETKKEVPPAVIQQGMDKQEVQKLLSAYMQSYGDSLSQKLGGLLKQSASLGLSGKAIARQNQRIQALAKQTKTNALANNQGFSITEVQMMVDNLKKENLKTMVDLLRLSNKNQKDYVGRAIADYARYVEDQRESDLKNINLTISNLDDKTKSKQLHSDRLLARVIEQVNHKKEIDNSRKR